MSARPARPRVPPAAVLEALGRGLAALVVTAGAAEGVAFAVYLAAGRPFHAWSFAKIGWLYLLTFSRVGLEVRLGPPVSTLLGGVTGATAYTVHVAFLLGTALSGWLLFHAGRGAARAGPGGAGIRVALGALVAPGYAAPAFLLGLGATIRLPDVGLASIGPVRWEALVFPLVMAAVAGGVGGLAASRSAIEACAPWGTRALAWAAGGWRALVALVGLGVVGLLVLAALHPAGVRAYVRWHQREGRTGAVVLAHEVLALPNIGMWIATPSMTGCDAATGPAFDARLLCPNGVIDIPQLAAFRLERGPPPSGSILLFVIPVAATMVGGAWAARGSASRAERTVRGAGAGVAFAALAGLTGWVAGIGIAGAGLGAIGIGPRPAQAAGLALAWGVGGGVAGALLSGRVSPGPGRETNHEPVQDAVGPDDAPEPPPASPPSPTSV